MPQIADWDEDGDLDLIVGERNGYIWLYLNNGTVTNPTLTRVGKVKANGSIIDVGYNSCLVIVDWNNDGKKDLIIGNMDRQMRIYLNYGENNAPIFGSYSVVANVRHYRGSPDIADMDNDGKKDLIVGDNDGYVNYHRNIGSDSSPSFASGVRLKTQGGSHIKVYSGAHIDLADWDADGSIDILVGDFYGYTEVYINTEIGSNVEDPLTELPVEFTLKQNYPNPFNSSTVIEFLLPKTERVKIEIFNSSGQKINTLIDTEMPIGSHKVKFDATNLPTGLFIYRILAGDCVDQKKCLYLK